MKAMACAGSEAQRAVADLGLARQGPWQTCPAADLAELQSPPSNAPAASGPSSQLLPRWHHHGCQHGHALHKWALEVK